MSSPVSPPPQESMEQIVEKFQKYIEKCKMPLFNNSKAMYYHTNEKGMFVIYFDSVEDALKQLDSDKIDEILKTKETAFPFKKDPYYITISRFLDAQIDAETNGTDPAVVENYKHTKNLLEYCDPEHAFAILLSVRYDPKDKNIVFQKIFLMTHPEGDNMIVHKDVKIQDEKEASEFNTDMKLARIFGMDAYTFKMMRHRIPQSTRELLVTSTDPLSDMKTIIRNIQRSKTCSFCNKENANFMCSSCKVAKYCARDCQVFDYERHKHGCSESAFYRDFLVKTVHKLEQNEKEGRVIELSAAPDTRILEPVDVPDELKRKEPSNTQKKQNGGVIDLDAIPDQPTLDPIKAPEELSATETPVSDKSE